MKIRIVVLLLLSKYLLSLSPEAIVKRVEDNLRGKSSKGEMVMRIVKKTWTRELHFKFWELGKDRSLILITAPAKEKGIATLKIGKNVWNYIPSIERVIKIPSSMMGASWMGSHFTNDDLVKEYSMTRDYIPKLKKQDEKFYYLVLYPKPEAAVVWGRIELKVDKKTFVPVEEDYFSEKGELVRKMVFQDVKKVGSHYFPFRWILYPVKKPGESTELLVKKIIFNVRFPKRLFSLRHLKELAR